MKPTNEQYNHWTILYVDEHGSRKHPKQCICRCDCGRLYKRDYFKLKYGLVAQCRECYLRTRHHLNHTRIHKCWVAMKQRCYNPTEKAHKWYGLRGIKVCNQWKNDFLAFYNWAMAHGYNDTLTIDRIDVNGDYCPENCRWVNQETQSNNRRSNISVTINGRTQNLTQWCKELGLPRGRIFARVERGWNPVEALMYKGDARIVKRETR